MLYRLASLFLLFLFATRMVAEEIVVDLNDPVHTNGAISTDSGGIITTKTMRIQGENLVYHEQDGQKILYASGNFLLVYHKKFFVGDAFEYNFSTQQGKITNGVTNIDGFYIGGRTILFDPDGTIAVCEAFATTCDSRHAEWTVRAGDFEVKKSGEAKASNVTFNIYKTPVFWLPFFSMSASKKDIWDSIAKYRFYWEKGQGPLFMVRYRLWDYEGLKIYWRGEYRITRGIGTALEQDYVSPDKRQKIQTRNFVAYDTFYNDNNPHKYMFRYRLQGLFSGKNHDGKMETFGRWDVLSDKNMRNDFPTHLFEIQTLERTEAFVKGRYDPAFTSIYARPRVNTFRGFKQELPTFKVALKPFVLSKSGVVMQNYFKLAYLDYVYANNLQGKIPDFHSSRFETHQLFYRPFQVASLNITPSIGFYGIYYGNNPEKDRIGQGVLEYSLESHATFYQDYSYHSHYLVPYLEFKGLTRPTASIGKVFIFSIEDGFHTLNQLKLGLRNSFFKRKWSMALARCGLELYAYDFFGNRFLTTFPKGGVDVEWNYPAMSFKTRLGWNFMKKTWDFTNFHLAYTYSENFAFSVGLHYRGKYDWRKNDHFNYILDVSHPVFVLADSPLSDSRTIFFTRWQINLQPLGTLSVQNHLGWRPHQPFYHETNINLTTIISNCWKFRFGYMRTVRTNQFTFWVNLI